MLCYPETKERFGKVLRSVIEQYRGAFCRAFNHTLRRKKPQIKIYHCLPTRTITCIIADNEIKIYFKALDFFYIETDTCQIFGIYSQVVPALGLIGENEKLEYSVNDFNIYVKDKQTGQEFYNNKDYIAEINRNGSIITIRFGSKVNIVNYKVILLNLLTFSDHKLGYLNCKGKLFLEEEKQRFPQGNEYNISIKL